MKGIVFTEFLDMVEAQFSADMVDDLIDACELEHGGAYTSVGTYNHEELVALISKFSQTISIATPELLQNFGQHLFSRFYFRFPQFFENVDNAFSFLETLDQHIHVEVLKLYPEAELPSFIYQNMSTDRITMTYQSSRPFNDLAEGLLIGCFIHFNETIVIQRKILSDTTLFTLTKMQNECA